MSVILTDRLTIFVAKSFFVGFLPKKNIFATPVFSMEKNGFPPNGKNLPTLFNNKAFYCHTDY